MRCPRPGGPTHVCRMKENMATEEEGTSEGGSGKRDLKRERMTNRLRLKVKWMRGGRRGMPTKKSSRPRGPRGEEGNGLSAQASHCKWIR